MFSLPDPILLATDGSEDARAAAHAAADLARHAVAQLHVVHVWQPPRLALPGEAGESSDEESGQAILDQALDEVRAAGAGVVVGHLRRGRPVDQILRVADQLEARLIVLGSRGLGPVRRRLVGSVSEGVIHRGTRPVLVLRDSRRHSWPPVRVVIGDDASVHARRAGDLGAAIGHMFGSTAVVVRALTRLPAQMQGDVDEDARTVDDAMRIAERSLATRAEELEPVLGQRPRVQIAIAEPAAALLSAAGDNGAPALIAVGTRGLGPVQRLRRGSVSTEVLRGARGAVLVNAHPH